ncbi:hypothetical protein E2986_11343 [Frieseomelitta varia]|uniref:Uncharacterized protein n=1 Tax=Frieseomelitta varia TaxID=561572 RepID=A0A833RP49_9HYME|nr:hypothetical protein E2986_11343 [Frieseomelitta varia]
MYINTKLNSFIPTFVQESKEYSRQQWRLLPGLMIIEDDVSLEIISLVHPDSDYLELSNFKFELLLTAIRGFMSASAMPLCSVTPCKVDQGPLYPVRSRGILEAPTKKKKRRGPLASEKFIGIYLFGDLECFLQTRCEKIVYEEDGVTSGNIIKKIVPR